MKKVFTVLAMAALSLFMAQKAAAIEDPDPAGTIYAGLNLTIAGPGANVFGEYVLKDDLWIGHLTVGATLGYMNKRGWYFDSTADPNNNWEYYYYYRSNQFFLIPRATYGLNLTNKIEVHAGVQIGFGLKKANKDAPEDLRKVKGMFCIGWINGVRFHITDRFAAQFEMNPGFNTPVFNLGVVYTF